MTDRYVIHELIVYLKAEGIIRESGEAGELPVIVGVTADGPPAPGQGEYQGVDVVVYLQPSGGFTPTLASTFQATETVRVYIRTLPTRVAFLKGEALARSITFAIAGGLGATKFGHYDWDMGAIRVKQSGIFSRFQPQPDNPTEALRAQAEFYFTVVNSQLRS